MDDYKNAYFVIANDQTIEMMSKECKATFLKHHFEIQDPPEYNAMRTIVIRNVDKQITEFSEEEIKENIENENAWAKIEQVIKIPNAPSILKIRFESTQMAKRALENGLLILFQFMPPRFVERDIFINLVPCYRCYKYDHLVKDRKETDTYKACSECASNDHTYKDCRENTKKCLNCNGNHRTLAAKCSIRKRIIKERTKEQRQSERRQTTADTSRQTTYAGATAATTNYSGARNNVTTTFNAETMLSSLPPNAAA